METLNLVIQALATKKKKNTFSSKTKTNNKLKSKIKNQIANILIKNNLRTVKILWTLAYAYIHFTSSYNM